MYAKSSSDLGDVTSVHEMTQVFRATPQDAEAASHALATLYHRGPADAERLEQTLDDPRFILFFARLADEWVAYLHAELLHRLDGTTMLLIYDIAVAPKQRRKGIATKLMQAVLALGRGVGASRCWLLTETENAAARGLYEKLDGDEWSTVGFGWRFE